MVARPPIRPVGGARHHRRCAPEPAAGRARAVVRGLLALAVLAVLLIGTPIALVVLVGWPLPTGIPSVEQVRDALERTGIPEPTVVKLLTVAVWLAWARLLVAVGAEVVATARHRPARVRTPFGRFAASLVGAVTGLAGPAAASGPVPPLAAVVRVVELPPPVEPPDGDVPPPVAPAAADTPARAAVWVVQPRDTLWGIAEQVLGTGERWEQLHRLNIGHEVAPGVVYQASTEVLRVGWSLLLPVAEGRTAGPTVRVVAGDTLSGLAARHLGDAARWSELWELNRGRRFGDRTFDDPDLVLVGWELHLPPVGAEPPSPVAPTDEDAVTGTTWPSVAPLPAASPDAATSSEAAASDAGATGTATTDVHRLGGPSDDDALDTPTSAPDARAWRIDTAVEPPPAAVAGVDEPPWVKPAAIAGATLLATGLAGLLSSRRRRRLRAAPASAVAVAPAPGLAALDALVRAGDDPLAVARLDLALRHLADAAATSTRVLAVLTHGARIEVVVAGPAGEPPSPWRGAAADRWVLPVGVPTEALVAGARGVPAPCPALVRLGTVDGTEVHVDVEAVGELVVEGPAEAGAAIVHSIVAGLAVSPLADVLHVVVVGGEPEAFTAWPRVQVFDTLADAFTAAAALSDGVAQGLAERDVPSTFALRARYPEEPWEPVVVVVLPGVDEPAAHAWAGSGGAGRALVRAGRASDQPWRLSAGTDGTWCLHPLELTLVPDGLTGSTLDALGGLLDAADTPFEPQLTFGEPAVQPEPVVEPHPAARTEPADAAANRPVLVPVAARRQPRSLVAAVEPPVSFVEPPWALLVRLLGPVDVVDPSGSPAVFERAKSLELIVWLAQHRDRPSRVSARTAMWETDVRDATFANVVSDARRGLARLVPPPPGEEWLGRSHGDRLPLHPSIRTDADLLAARLDHARRLPDRDAIELLRPGLALVRDVPYAGTAYLWPDGEALPSGLVLLATSAAVELARRCLAADDVDGVFWATAQGLKALPGHEELVCLRMEAHARRGDLAGVRAEFESYERQLANDPWCAGEPSAKVLAARARLGRASPPWPQASPIAGE